MRVLVLAFDYDGTLAQDGTVDDATIEMLSAARASGRKLVMVTGRDLDDLHRVFSHEDLFELIVAENGALLYAPSTKEETPLAEAPPQPLVAALKTAGVTPLAVGRSVIATWEPNQTAVLDAIKALGLEWQITFNKGAVMVLPAGVNKGSGLAAALDRMRMSTHNTLGIGDAENDHAFLAMCEWACAVSNALPFVKERADFVSEHDHGAGVRDILTRVLEDRAMQAFDSPRHRIALDEEEDAWLNPWNETILIAGASGSGKSTVAHALREQLHERGYQYCVIDPEGDYREVQGAVSFGDTEHRPDVHSVLQHLEDPRANAVVNLLGIPLADRPAYFMHLLPQLLELRARLGHPHWIFVDEAHHMLPAGWEGTADLLPQSLVDTLMITVHPESVSRPVLDRVRTMIGVGSQARESAAAFAGAVGEVLPAWHGGTNTDTALMWRRDSGDVHPFTPRPPRGELHRHKRKYAKGDLDDNSFYFRGPDGKLNLRAQNLTLFAQIAEGVDDDTWLFHLENGDYADWFRTCVKDDELAEVAEHARSQLIDAAKSRSHILEAIEARYTAPVDGSPST